MHKHADITEGRIQAAIEHRLRPLVYPQTTPVTIDAWDVGGEPVAYDCAITADYRPFAVGEKWGGAWDTTWFRITAQVPDAWAGRDVRLRIDLGPEPTWAEGISCEGLVYLDGRPTTAVNLYHDDAIHLAGVQGGETITLYVEAAANIRPENVADGSWQVDKDFGGPGRFTLKRCELACYDAEAERLLFAYELLFDVLKLQPADTPRRGQILYGLNHGLNLLVEDKPGTLATAYAAIEPLLNKRNGDTAHTVSAVGHAHIDTAWLWPLRETIRKCARTFSTVLRYMDQYPDFVFACSQPQQYAWMKRHYPSIYAGIQAAVKRGQWQPIGSMWIEADCNIPSGESLVRQLLHGKRFFQEHFGIETTDLWIPDVFGYSAALPQLLKQAGIDSFLTQKISWNQFNRFPHHTFLWRGLDGSEVFTHFPPADTYNGNFTANEVAKSSTRFLDHDRATCSLYPFGHGDGGGGPTRQMIENARLLKDLEGMPRVRMETTTAFFNKAKADAVDLPVWSGELYLELHRGTYTTQAAVKRANRRCEGLLREAEFYDTLATLLKLDCEPVAIEALPLAVYEAAPEIDAEQRRGRAAALDRAWKLLLLNQFHDIIPGSSIQWVYEDAARDYAVIEELAGRVRDAALGPILGVIPPTDFDRPAAVLNTLGHDRGEVIDLPEVGPRYVEAPACGYSVIDLSGSVPAEPPEAVAPISVIEADSSIRMTNGLVTLEIDRRTGELTSVIDHRAGGREVLAPMPGHPAPAGNILQLHPDRPNKWGAWDIDIHAYETATRIDTAEQVQCLEAGPLRATVRVRRAFNRSTLHQDIVLRAGSARIDFVTHVDWQERHMLLKAAFPVAVHSPRATYEVQFGHVERPTHFNTSWDLARFEVCAHRWADLSEGGSAPQGGYGVALLNDCKYGHDIQGHVMRLSLLRGPIEPDPGADLGEHTFTYALLPHPGGFREARVIEQAANLNSPLRVQALEPNTAERTPTTGPASHAWLRVEPAGVTLDTTKVAESGEDIVVRLYEAFGRRCEAVLHLPPQITRAQTCDLLERPANSIDIREQQIRLSLRPFEVVSLRLG